MTADLAGASATELAALVRERAASPSEVVGAVLDRIDAWEPSLNAFVTLDREGALNQARQADAAIARGDVLGPLHGVPVTVKNIMDVAGLPTRRGSRLTPDTPANADAPVVERLRAAGAIVVGTTTLPERAWTAVSSSPLTGHTHNPWRHGLTSGGSSSGAAALAGAGCGPLHVGSDGAGSVRLPAHFCGAVGFKPTYGRVPYVPVPSNGNISHIGPITRTVPDAALMYAVMAGPDPRDLTTLPGHPRSDLEEGGLAGLRIAFSPDLGHARVDPTVATVVEHAVQDLAVAGAVVDVVTPPWGPTGPDVERDIWGLALLGYAPASAAEREQMDPGLLACIDEYAGMTARAAVAAQRRRLDYAEQVNAWFADSGWDLLVTPSASVTAFEVGRQQPTTWPPHPWDWITWAEFSYPFNLAHGPAISVPAGLATGGLPVGLQVAGPRLRDDLVLRAAAAFLAVRPFDRLPGRTT